MLHVAFPVWHMSGGSSIFPPDFLLVCDWFGIKLNYVWLQIFWKIVKKNNRISFDETIILSPLICVAHIYYICYILYWFLKHYVFWVISSLNSICNYFLTNVKRYHGIRTLVHRIVCTKRIPSVKRVHFYHQMNRVSWSNVHTWLLIHSN